MDIEQHLGAKVSVMIAGLIGSIVSLTFMRDLTAGRAFLYI
ncbi:peptidase M48, Ste24p, partial [Roseibium sp. TrichSKD4]